MVNTLTSTQLNVYLFDRLHNYPIGVLYTEEGDGVRISAAVRKSNRVLILRPEVMKDGKRSLVEISIESDFPDAGAVEASDFVKEFVDTDKIFDKGNPLYSEERQQDLPRLRSILKRVRKKGKISCQIIDKQVNDETLRRAVWNYMIRPALCCIYYVGRK